MRSIPSTHRDLRLLIDDVIVHARQAYSGYAIRDAASAAPLSRPRGRSRRLVVTPTPSANANHERYVRGAAVREDRSYSRGHHTHRVDRFEGRSAESFSRGRSKRIRPT